jgi:TrmH family RNA methyltransferase
MTGAPHSSVKRYRELARNPQKNGRHRELLLDGAHLVFEARKSGLTVASAAFENGMFDDPAIRTLAEQLVAEGADVFIVSKNTLASMSPVKTPSGVIAIASRSIERLDSVLGAPDALVVIAHDIQDPGNVGGIMRTAEAAGATAFVTTPSTADPLGWKALRGSMGSALRLPIASAGIDETLDALRKNAITPVALVPRDGESLFRVNLRAPMALVLGGEGPGLPHDVVRRIERCVSIPMAGPVESLNVGVAAALVLYEVFRQRSRDQGEA